MTLIKTYKPILLILFSLALFSCDSDIDSNQEDNEQVSQEIIAFEEETETNTENNKEASNTFDGTEVIEKILGEWKHDSNGECDQKNIIEFKLQNVFKFTQHQKTFTQRDLRNYNVFSAPIGSDFTLTAHKGNNVAVFDTRAECQFNVTSTIEYVVIDEKTIELKNNPNVKIVLENDDTLKLIHTFTDSNSIIQVREFVYKKL